jgi:hypothetical protein
LPNGCRLRWWPLLLLGWLVAISAPAAAQRDCSPATIAKARREFQRAYDAKDYERAAAFIEPIELDCVANRVDDIDPVLAAAISSDAAITAHRQGDDGECLQWLLDYLPMPRHGNPKLDSLPAGLRAAIVHNVELCKPHLRHGIGDGRVMRQHQCRRGARPHGHRRFCRKALPLRDWWLADPRGIER